MVNHQLRDATFQVSRVGDERAARAAGRSSSRTSSTSSSSTTRSTHTSFQASASVPFNFAEHELGWIVLSHVPLRRGGARRGVQGKRRGGFVPVEAALVDPGNNLVWGATVYPRPSYANLVPHPGVGGERRGELVAHGDDLTRFFFFSGGRNPKSDRPTCGLFNVGRQR